MKYQRIIIIGPAGAGKTTLAKHLSSISKIPVIHLDHEYWLPNWQRPDEAEFAKKVDNFAQQDSWIMEGNYYKSLEIRLKRADLVIELNPSKLSCINGILRRVKLTKQNKIVRDDLAEGCEENIDYSLLKWSYGYARQYAPVLHRIIKKYPEVKVVSFSSRVQAHNYIVSLMEE